MLVLVLSVSFLSLFYHPILFDDGIQMLRGEFLSSVMLVGSRVPHILQAPDLIEVLDEWVV